MAQTTAGTYREYIGALQEILRSRDVARMRQFVVEHISFDESFVWLLQRDDAFLERVMCHGILSSPSLSDLHAWARERLGAE